MQTLRDAKALMEAVQNEDLRKTRRLLIEGAKANLIIDGVSAFHLTVGIECADALDFVKVMLKYGGDPNVRSAEGMTPVLIAAAYGRYQALCLLIDMGGDPTLTDESGKNAVNFAKESESWDCMKILQDWERQDPDDLDISDSPIHQISDIPNNSSIIPPIQDKIISETYLATKQGFDVTSPDHPLWFFKGSPGTTVIECSNLDKTIACPSRFNDTSCSSIDDSRPSTPTSSFDVTSSTDDPRKLAFSDLSLTTSDTSDLPPPPPPSENSSPWSRTSDSLKSLLNESSPMISSDTSSSPDSVEGFGPSHLTHVSSQNSRTSSINSSLAMTSSLSNSSVLTQLIEDTSTEYMHHDTEAETVLIERQCPSASKLRLDSMSGLETTCSDATVIYDWTQYQSLNSTCPCSPSKQDTTAIGHLTDQELREQLSEFGYNVGPITETTRKVYERKLNQLRQDPEAQKQLAAGTKEEKGFRWELASYLNGNLQIPTNFATLETEMEDEYEKKDNWREGKLKSSFNYILLDPRVTSNLPLRCTSMTELEVFTCFVNAIFYIGKGKRNRPYAHFNEALHVLRDEDKQPGQKVAHILDIWQEGLGVVSLHCFQNVIPVEAYTREACMIDCIGLQRLTNSIKGNFYGHISSWAASRQRLMGIYLLKKACQMLLLEGERQIRPADIKKV